jgi:hypothetical protein
MCVGGSAARLLALQQKGFNFFLGEGKGICFHLPCIAYSIRTITQFDVIRWLNFAAIIATNVEDLATVSSVADLG